ncbi:mechanosensitive ion channel family protein [Mycoplasmatota bacterium]|nr:mechanosensitive ion channel family protein [Mycoplasmatota bacterium]
MTINILLIDNLSKFINEYFTKQKINQVLISSIKILLILVLSMIIIKLYKRLITRLLKLNTAEKRKTTIGKVVLSVGKYTIWFITAMLILNTLNVDIAPILASAGILGLAVGLGSQKLVADFLNGLFILFEESFSVGEIVEIDGFTGEVIDIGLRTTAIKGWRGALKIINNGDINTIVNHSRFNTIAVVDFKVSYESDLDKLEKILSNHFQENVYQNIDLLDKPIYVGVVSFEESEIICRVISTCKPYAHFQFERDLRNDIKVVLQKNNIEIPYPHIVVQN